MIERATVSFVRLFLQQGPSLTFPVGGDFLPYRIFANVRLVDIALTVAVVIVLSLLVAESMMLLSSLSLYLNR